MEKYFSIEMRLAEGAKEVRPGIFQLTGNFYYGDGYIKIEDNKISGVIAFDYIEGEIGENTVEMCLYTEDKEYEMAIDKDDFCLPQNFLMLYENVAIEFSIEEAIKSPQKQKSIQEEIETARTYVGFQE